MSANPDNVIEFPEQPQQPLGLPGPRIWTAEMLAEFLGVSASWVKRMAQPSSPDDVHRWEEAFEELKEIVKESIGENEDGK